MFVQHIHHSIYKYPVIIVRSSNTNLPCFLTSSVAFGVVCCRPLKHENKLTAVHVHSSSVPSHNWMGSYRTKKKKKLPKDLIAFFFPLKQDSRQLICLVNPNHNFCCAHEDFQLMKFYHKHKQTPNITTWIKTNVISWITDFLQFVAVVT